MNEQELRIIKMNHEMQQTSLKEKCEVELDQDDINKQVKSGEVVFLDTALLMKRVPFGDYYTMMIPENFDKMRDEFIKRKYPNEERPQLVYTNPSTQINITFSETPHEVSNSGLETFVYNVLSTIRKAQPTTSIISDGVKQISDSGINVGYFDFVTPSIDKEIYNFMIIFLHQEKANFITINCPEEMKHIWKPLAYGMMESLQKQEGKRNDYRKYLK